MGNLRVLQSKTSRQRCATFQRPETLVFQVVEKLISGPEYLTVFDGMSGKALHTTWYLPGRAGTGTKTANTNTGGVKTADGNGCGSNTLYGNGKEVISKSCTVNFRIYWDGSCQDQLFDGSFDSSNKRYK